ncbi:MAG: D-tyrosyl-tRNA(Tyr) deacylase [Planctomycetaceae bacterium]|nr:D-tyrosyl-tRNA(Tyr) deacylase [Planctomycetaceae bacterium]
MRSVVQRVGSASVEVDGRIVGAIDAGLLVLLGVSNGDSEAEARWTARKIAKLRIFTDEAGRLNRSVIDAGGSVLLVSQFTLCANTSEGNRPSFTGAAPPETARPLVELTGELIQEHGVTVATGRFGASMLVRLENDGPITIVLDSPTAPQDDRSR